jgi:hypothetical protein
MPRCDGVWVAEITEAGRFYLDHGYHPDKPAKAPQATPPAQPLHLSDDKDLMAEQLIDQLRQESGTLRIPDPDDDTRKRYRSAISLAKRRAWSPTAVLCCIPDATPVR